MAKNIFETLLGAIVLIVAVGFVVMAYNTADVSAPGGYNLTAKFERVDGLRVGSDVRVSGLRVGSVKAQNIDPKTYEAIVTFSVDNNVPLPKDSSAEIISDGLLGEKYMALIPGGAEDMLQDNDNIQFTQSAISIESLIGKFLFGSAENDGSEGSEDEDIF